MGRSGHAHTRRGPPLKGGKYEKVFRFPFRGINVDNVGWNFRGEGGGTPRASGEHDNEKRFKRLEKLANTWDFRPGWPMKQFTIAPLGTLLNLTVLQVPKKLGENFHRSCSSKLPDLLSIYNYGWNIFLREITKCWCCTKWQLSRRFVAETEKRKLSGRCSFKVLESKKSTSGRFGINGAKVVATCNHFGVHLQFMTALSVNRC